MIFRFLLFVSLSALAFEYDQLLVDAQTSIIGKIAVLDRDIQNKLIGGKLVIAVVHEPKDADEAKEIASKINNSPNQAAITLKALTVEFSQFPKSDASFAYILRSNDANIKKAAIVAKQKGIASFAYEKSDIANGVMLSMHFERSAVITLKRSALKESGVQFLDSFYKIVRIVE